MGTSLNLGLNSSKVEVDRANVGVGGRFEVLGGSCGAHLWNCGVEC